MEAAAAALFDNAPEMGVEFGRASGDIDRCDGAAAIENGQKAIDGGGGHALRALRPGLDVTVVAGLIADFSNVDLQSRDLGFA